jgi:hypothetical protein
MDQQGTSRLARQVATYSFITLNVSMLIGAFVLRIFGIEMPVLRLAGGIIIALTAWRLLNAEDNSAQRGAVLEEAGTRDASHLAFYPLTMPMTTGRDDWWPSRSAQGRPGADNPLFGVQALVTTTLICLSSTALPVIKQDRTGHRPDGTSWPVVAFFCIGIQVRDGHCELVGSLQK